jgi:hypothetical protein
MTTDFDTMLDDADLYTRTVPVCLKGSLVAEFEALEADLQAALIAPDADSKEGSGAQQIAERMEQLREQMTAATYPFKLQALPKPKYRELKAKYPPRQDDEGTILDEDRMLDANMDDFPGPLLRACVVDPVLDDTTWARLEEKLTDRQYEDLAGMAIHVNKGGVNVPFSPDASKLRRSTAAG